MRRNTTILLILLLIDCVAIFVIWALNIFSGAFPNGLFTGQREVSLPFMHLSAELLMAGITLVGVLGLFYGRIWARGITLFGLGMFTYSAINSMGWAILNDPIQAVPMVITILLAIVVVPPLLYWEVGEK